MSVDRRNPKRVPPLADLLPRDPKRAGELLELYLKKLGIGAYVGLPAPHSATHAVGSDDPLPAESFEQAEIIGLLSYLRTSIP